MMRFRTVLFQTPSFLVQLRFSRTVAPTNKADYVNRKRRKEKSLRSFDKFVRGKATNEFDQERSEYEYEDSGPYRCTAVMLGKYLDTKKIYATLSKNNQINEYQNLEFLHIQYTQQNFNEAEQTQELQEENLNIDKKYLTSPTKNIFFFKEGSIVCWGMNISEEQSWIDEVKSYTLSDITSEINLEEMSYNLGDKTCIEADTIMLNKHTPSKLHREEMLAYSAGLVRSLQLEFLENETEEFMKKIKTIPGDIRADKLPNRKTWATITADQMQVSYRLNLNSTLLDVPELFWENHSMGVLFKEMQENMDIPERIDTLSKRLDLIERIINTVQSMISEKTSHRLEEIIILLIFIEVMFYVLDKSVTWREMTIESVYYALFPSKSQ